ncbi:MAG TPA: hypothetical protein VJZ04_10265 [Lachnospiraceae bacterium]|nr:hypothetical protein [Lachnospiraceae bacterium]
MAKKTQIHDTFKLSILDIALIGVMVATIEVGKIALSFLPNIELVSLLIILYTLFFGKKVLYAIFTFVLIEGCLYGFGVWWIMYLYIWPLLALITYQFRHQRSVFLFSIISGTFGLFFGALCSIPYFFIGGISMAFSYWVSGLLFDVIHCIGNTVVCLTLFVPLRTVLKKVTYSLPQ